MVNILLTFRLKRESGHTFQRRCVMKRSFGSFNVISYWALGLFLCPVGMMAANLLLQLANNTVGALGLLVLSLAALIYSPITGHHCSNQARHEFTNNLPRLVIALASGIGCMLAWVLFSVAFSSQADLFWNAGSGWKFAVICTRLGSFLAVIGLGQSYHNCLWMRNR